MSASDSWKLLVFRDGKVLRDARELLLEFLHSLQSVCELSDFASDAAREMLLEALLRCGELECALADAGCDSAQITSIAAIIDRLATALLSGEAPEIPGISLGNLEQLVSCTVVKVSPPEGFSYYALHPLDCADLLSELQLRPVAAAVIGIRSIGTTLSAVVRGWFEVHGIPAERICVRPEGHPFDRQLSLSADERRWIRSQSGRGAMFLVVDEGPGLSGSSFLAVGEALLENGVAPEQIVFIPSSEPDLNALLAPHAATRWSKFRTVPLKPTRHIPKDAQEDIGGGRWRNVVFPGVSDWPASWVWTERKKYLSASRDRFFRFDGLSQYGNAVRHRSHLLAEHGWGPSAEAVGNGFTAFPWLDSERMASAAGGPLAMTLAPAMVSQEEILQAAQYCAFRAEHFQTEVQDQSALEHMARTNLERAIGIHLPQDFQLPIERAVIADARMMPHEWIVSDGRLLKTDASCHGDDHFFPGPTDIAWDLAGLIVEWGLDQHQSHTFLDEYRRTSRDNAEPRLTQYLTAYSAFRLGFTLSAAQSVADAAEKQRFTKESRKYGEKLDMLIRRSTAA